MVDRQTTRRGRRRLALIALIATATAAAAAAALSGCDTFKGGRTDGTAAAEHWQIRPASMRVYPSTRFIRYDNQLALEARVEFQDELRDPIKAVGTLHFEVFPVKPSGEVERARLFSWDVPMLAKSANREFYDAVTRAYLFRLGVDQLPADLPRVLLRVSFEPPAGPRLATEAVIATQ